MIVLGISADDGYGARVALALTLWKGSRRDLADAMGLTMRHRDVVVWHYMNGRAPRDLRRLQALCTVVGVPSSLVLNGPTEALRSMVDARLAASPPMESS